MSTSEFSLVCFVVLRHSGGLFPVSMRILLERAVALCHVQAIKESKLYGIFGWPS